ncbi:hypothetical protein ABL78_1680 [Leptomonas seymouri]|uniref:TFIIH C1-like domain-containing protein n=1 Tax=Leptomonas seymouri TaxID=5684 RepID=A0A0N1I8I5_LEPSE|nr:hypothetical protein ABL78_1680 [Leptomonas seymouri]|eukprot:KPI89188.1 hypothetical protein ABL78_1680 [Leptomonas seymouri]
MLRTVLLIDGSETMNSSSDYLPNYLLAMRPPLLRIVERYLDSTPLASLGIVVMRDGISHRLLPCTTSRNEVVDVLERDVFLHGGSGSMSLENGLRMTMSELVDMRKVAALAASKSSPSKVSGVAAAAALAAKNQRAVWKGSATQLNVLLVSASVTLIDPTDVFNVVNLMAALSVRINVLSLVGAVHVFDLCAMETGGKLYCPMNYDHLLRIADELATAHRAHTRMAANRKGQRPHRGKRVWSSTSGEQDGGEDGEDEDADAPHLIPIGCPVYLKAPPPPPPSQQMQQQSSNAQPSATADADPSYYLACPQCHLVQMSVPVTCPMCRLLLCSAPMLYSTYVSHNSLVPAAKRLRVVRGVKRLSAHEGGRGETLAADGTSPAEMVNDAEDAPIRCALCMTRIPADEARTAAAPSSAVGSGSSEDAWVWQCSSCASYRCNACNDFVLKTLGLCPHCLALR